jgi:hypothetical protein
MLGEDPPAMDVDRAPQIRLISVKFVPPTSDAAPRSIEERIRGLLSSLLHTRTTQILPFDASSTAPELLMSDLSSTTETQVYLPHTSCTKTADTIVGKSRVKSTQSLYEIKKAIMPTLDDHAISLSNSKIAAGSTDIGLGWFYQNIPRFCNFEAITDEIARVTNVPAAWFTLNKKALRFDKNTTAEVVYLTCAVEKEAELLSALLAAYADPNPFLLSTELLSYTFIPRTLKQATQLAILTKHNEYLQNVKYCYVQNLANIDSALNVAGFTDSTTVREALSYKTQMAFTPIICTTAKTRHTTIYATSQ